MADRSIVTRAGQGARLMQGLFVLALGALWAGPAAASIVVFHSPGDDGVAASSALELDPNTDVFLNLWLVKGTTSSPGGTVCVNASGDEICAWDVNVVLDGDATILSWSADVSMESSVIVGGPAADNKSLRINRLLETPLAGPTRVGVLHVDVGSGSASVTSVGNHIISADKRLETVTPQTLAQAPEPSAGLLLGSGLVGLLWLDARRRHMRAR